MFSTFRNQKSNQNVKNRMLKHRTDLTGFHWRLSHNQLPLLKNLKNSVKRGGKKRERKIFHLLVHFLNVCQGWARLKPGLRSFIWVFRVDTGAPVWELSSAAFPGTRARSCIGSKCPGLERWPIGNAGTTRSWLYLPCHDSPQLSFNRKSLPWG